MTALQAKRQVTLRKAPSSRAVGRSIAGGLLLAAIMCVCAIPLAFLLANPMLAIRDHPGKADVIVVLGGDGPSRAARAADLWLQGLAPRVLVSGDGDCYWIRKGMIEGGVDPGAISVECESGTTWQNAAFSAPILEKMHAHTAILVTSWYHSRRAISTFAAASPEVSWLSLPVERSQTLWRYAFGPDAVQLLKEYPKTVWYAVRLLVDARPGAAPVFPSEART